MFILIKKIIQKELAVLQKDSLKNELAMLRTERELFELTIDHKTEQQKNKKQLELAYENMVNSLRAWESKYLLKSRSEGRIILGNTWAMNNMINRGDTLCSIISGNQSKLIGRIQLSQDHIAGIMVGNAVNIELSKYPAHSYGYLVGEVASISYPNFNTV